MATASKPAHLDKATSVNGTAGLAASLSRDMARLADLQAQIDESLASNTLSEQDHARLSRVAQMTRDFLPKRTLTKNPKFFDQVRERATTLFNLLARKDAKPKAPLPDPYLLAEETLTLLRSARARDVALSRELSGVTPPAAFLDRTFSGNPASKETIETSLTLSYEQKNWGVERICLDGTQNHLPSDAKGTKIFVQCLVGDRWLDLDAAREQAPKISAVRFADDGVGFDVNNLKLFWSTKTGQEEAESRGQFGEGMKMIASAAVREKLGMVIESQDWRAVPRGKTLSVNNTRKKENENVDQLVFDVEHFTGEAPLKGSRTLFLTPTPAFIAEVLKLDDKVLELKPGYRPFFTSENGQVAALTPGQIFVKGTQVEKASTIFSYNFNDAETNRDRNKITSGSISSRVQKITAELDNKRLIKLLLSRAGKMGEGAAYALELDNSYPPSKYPQLWKESFQEVFGPQAVLDTGYEIPAQFADRNFTKIKFPADLRKRLVAAGVPTDKDAIPDSHNEMLPTSLTLDYGRNLWSEERMILDGGQNHLPRDSGGSDFMLRFRTKDGTWHQFPDLKHFEDDQIDAIKISDDGRGFDHRMLGLLYSSKADQGATGKFGEGLKMLCAAALRSGVDVSVRSRRWQAMPKAVPVEIEGKQIQQMQFEIVHATKPGILGDGDPYAGSEASATTFYNPTKKLLDEYRNIDQKILAYGAIKPLLKTEAGSLISLGEGRLFVREVLIPGDHNLKYSYHLPDFDIKSRDRSDVPAHELKNEIGKVWSKIDDAGAIKDFLYQAQLAAQNGQESVDFQSDFTPQNPGRWVEVFQKTFGENAAIRSANDQDFNALHENAHLGLKTISVPPAVYKTLSQCADDKGNRIATYTDTLHEANKIEIIPDDRLTPEEVAILRTLEHDIYPIIAGTPGETGSVVAYEPRGKHVAAGLSGTPVKINRTTLMMGLTISADVYIHELTHNFSKASDADAGFRNFLTSKFAQVAVKMIKPNEAADATMTLPPESIEIQNSGIEQSAEVPATVFTALGLN